MLDYAAARRTMVESQLRPNRIDDGRVLGAMLEIPREIFVAKSLRGVAYGDADLDLGDGRWLIAPLAMGKLLQAAAPRPTDVALVIGCDTGYGAAVLSRLVATVFLLLPDTTDSNLIERALGELGCDNVVIQKGGPAQGLPSQAPFDLVLLTLAIARPPAALLDQLGDDGRLVAVMQERTAGRVTVCQKIGGAMGRRTPFDAAVPELAGLREPPAFVF